MPAVSIVIPAYNADRTILETIESVQNQTFTDFEIIVINDGSTDRTLEVLQSINDDRLKIFTYENGGVSTARNRGIAHAVGEFIAFLDSDDLWTPDKLELQYPALKHNPTAGVAYSWTQFMDEQGDTRIFRPAPPTQYAGQVYAQLLKGDFIYSGSNVLVRRQVINEIGLFDPTLSGCADWDYWTRLAADWEFAVVSKYQILYRRSPVAMSSKVEEMREVSLRAIEKAFKTAPSELQHLKKLSLVGCDLYCARLHLLHGNDIAGINQAGTYLRQAVIKQPSLLLRLSTHKMLAKFLLMRVLSPTLVKQILTRI